jgi:RND family efflux transporter MFP subunit
MKRRTKFILTALGSVTALVLMFLYLTGTFSPGRKIRPGQVAIEEQPAAGLRTIEIQAATIPVVTEAVGAVAARETAEVSSRIMAQITTVSAQAGDAVRKGQALFELDPRDAKARLKQAREGLAAAEAELERASLDAGRIERLYEKQAATKQEYDRAQAAYKAAQAGAEAAKAAVSEAQVFLSHATISSPIDGTVIDRLADPGDMAAPGRPLMTVYDPSTLRLEVSVAEGLRPKVRPGDTVAASIDSIGVEFEGLVEEVVPASDVASRSFIVRVAVPASANAYPGMYGRIRLSVGSTETILLPAEAVQHVGQLEMVTVVENGIAHMRAVKTGKQYPEGIEVLSGLAPGETVALPRTGTD